MQQCSELCKAQYGVVVGSYAGEIPIGKTHRGEFVFAGKMVPLLLEGKGVLVVGIEAQKSRTAK